MKKFSYHLRNFVLAFGALAFVLLVASCGKDDEGEALINPEDANALSEVLIMPSGTDQLSGSAPNPSGSGQAPIVQNLNSAITSSNGATAPLNFNYSNTNNDLAGCYVQIAGADTYFEIPYSTTSDNNGDLQLPLGIPTNVNSGQFCVNFRVYNEAYLISNVVTTCVDVLRLGTGAIQVSLSWNTATDQDLYVEEPGGETINYINSSSASGGMLDRDDTNGYGPENIFWLDNAPDGDYKVSVDDFGFTSTENTCYITVSGLDVSRSFTVTTINGDKVPVVTFTKSGDSISF